MKSTRPDFARGFTLIELLVVIAIITILSAISFGSLYLGREKAKDAAIKVDLHTIQTQMEFAYNSSAAYSSTTCVTNCHRICQIQGSPLTSPPTLGNDIYVGDPIIKAALTHAIAQGGYAYACLGTSGTTLKPADYAVAVRLKSDSANWWCVDSSGSRKKVPDVGGGSPNQILNSLNLGSGANTPTCP